SGEGAARSIGQAFDLGSRANAFDCTQSRRLASLTRNGRPGATIMRGGTACRRNIDRSRPPATHVVGALLHESREW
ncbi:hypothetical protein, partial [Xanthomonas perforans]|uniref:hypothetical protein n=1 Tax=Xanthomonas perforans TaxID=442694 RepID=UPI0019CF9663